MTYIQCKLIKGTATDVAWIPKMFAVKGKYLSINNDNGWLVHEVFKHTELDYETVNRNSRDWLRTRNVSDI